MCSPSPRKDCSKSLEVDARIDADDVAGAVCGPCAVRVIPFIWQLHVNKYLLLGRRTMQTDLRAGYEATQVGQVVWNANELWRRSYDKHHRHGVVSVVKAILESNCYF